MANQPDATADHDPAIINLRKLVALDMVFHGPTFILAEFAFGVFGSLALGLVIAYPGFTSHFTVTQILVSSYVLCIALNYAPLLLYAISIARRKSAREEVAFELEHKDHYARKYTGQSFLLLLPVIVPLLALYQLWQKQTQAQA
jgi:UDP-N-acetylmuramyl pentapeptide phosphotransferase/UDP-N-acetylglucosamine-1-phosphate transferase